MKEMSELKKLKLKLETLKKVNSALIDEVNKYKYDMLTGFKLRIDFNEKMTNMFKEIKTRYTQMHDKELNNKYIVIIDVNRLHYINNKYDYVAGDNYLTSISKIIVKKYPNGDFYRIGGDEFAVITNNSVIPDVRNTSAVSLRIADFNTLEELIVAACRLLVIEKKKWYSKHKLERRG